MSNRASQIILLCEDNEHRRFALAYMKRCRINTQRIVVEEVASLKQRGGNDAWVLRQFPVQLHACRQRQKRAETCLVVLIDADKITVDERRKQLNDRLHHEGHEQLKSSDPVVLLIPRRHIETWIHALKGETVTEDEYYKGRKPLSKEDVRLAADTAYAWSRPNVTLGATTVPSLLAALPELRKIG
jgi:hypothetical protein